MFTCTYIHVHAYQHSTCETTERITELFAQEWHDDFLAWNESNYDDLIHFVVPATTVWLPDIGFKNRCLLVCFIPLASGSARISHQPVVPD